jgi:hypothetical protein
MNRRTSRKRILRRLSALLLALVIPLAGLSFSRERGGQNPAAPPEESRPALGDGAEISGQIERGSVFAARIEKSKKVRVLIPGGEKDLRRPIILAKGIASRTSIDGLEIIGGGYNEATFIPWNEVKAIQTRKSYVAIGALAGFATGVLVGLDKDISVGFAFRGAVYGLAGAIVGSVIKRWKTVYIAPREANISPRFSLGLTRRGGPAVTLSLSF